MTLPKISLETISVTAEQATRKPMTYGLVMSAVKAQIEADELNEAWGE